MSASHGQRYSTKIYLRGMLLLHAQGMKAEALFVYDLPLSHQPDQMPPSSFLIRTNYSLSLSQSHSTFNFLYFCFCGPTLPRARSASGLPMPPRYIARSFSSASKHHRLGFFFFWQKHGCWASDRSKCLPYVGPMRTPTTHMSMTKSSRFFGSAVHVHGLTLPYLS